MRILGASKVWQGGEESPLLARGAVAYEAGRIVAVGEFDALRARFPEASAEFEAEAILIPGLINAHTHLEFSANTTTLTYGSFGAWLDSVITHRESLMGKANEAMQKAIDEMLDSGTTTIGAISSAGGDLEALAHSPLRVLFFNEAIGSNPAALDFLLGDFKRRLEESKRYASARFTPAVAIHSPYSVHPALLKRVMAEAQALEAPVSVHFLESREEREWLEESKGYFGGFFARFFGGATPKALYSPLEFLEALGGKRCLLVHGVQMEEVELARAKAQGAILVSCPRSNRLLGGKLLDLTKVKRAGVPWLMATDGKSSNDSLSILDELRIALFAYDNEPLEALARELLLSVTSRAAEALGLACGRLEADRRADMALFRIEGIGESEQELLQLLLHAKKAERLFIEGEEVKLRGARGVA